MRVVGMPGMMARRSAATGARTHFLLESQARQAERRRDFGKKMAPVITRKHVMEMREREASRRKEMVEGAKGTKRALKEWGRFISWAREKLGGPKRNEIEFGGVRLTSHETEALRNLVNKRKLSPSEERMVGEALEKLVRKGGAEGRKRTQAA